MVSRVLNMWIIIRVSLPSYRHAIMISVRVRYLLFYLINHYPYCFVNLTHNGPMFGFATNISTF